MRKLKIVVLDGYTTNPGDLSWDWLKALGETTVYDRTPADLIRERVENADIIFTNKTPLNEEIISGVPNLKYIGLLSTGYNIIDLEAASKRNIVVANIPDYSTGAVAQMTFALLLELCNQAAVHSDAVRKGDWSKSKDFTFWNTPLTELFGKTFGVIGYGKIGHMVADIAIAMKMKVFVCTTHPKESDRRENLFFVTLNDLLKDSDVVSIHTPLTPETKGLVSSGFLRKMKPTAFLINTSRGPAVVDGDLADALNNGIIAGAGLDVLSAEPPESNNPLLTAKNCVITPHIAWASFETRQRLMKIAEENFRAFLSGKPVNTVNK